MPQSLSNVLLHVVWSTKNREPWIADSIRERFHSYVVGVLENLECPSLETNSEPDHIHILCRLSRTRTISKLIEQTKTSTSSWLKTVDGISSHFSWQGGYAAFSVSESQVPVVKKYIQQQREHHRGNRRLSFQDELRALLKKSGVAFDERYLCD
jgi:REP-associated tyrosine transposase